MDSLGRFLFLIGATALGILGIWHETRWRRRLRNWRQTRGKVVGIAETRPSRMKTVIGGKTVMEDGPWPEIEFRMDGMVRRFISNYGGSGIPRVGAEVDVLVDPATGEAEHVSLTNRWMLTLMPLLLGALLFWFGFVTP